MSNVASGQIEKTVRPIRSLGARRKAAPFQIGDRVRLAVGGPVLTVSWSSKNPSTRGDQMIATEHNGFCHPRSDADLYEFAEVM